MMPNDALNQMIAESPVIAPEGEAGAFTPDAAPTVLDAPPLPEPIKAMVGQGVFAASRLACSAANVTPLDGQEVAVLAEAVSGVLRFYITPDMDPKSAAWLGLGIAAVSIAVNRKPLAPKVEVPPPSENDNPSPNTVTLGDGTVISA